MRRRLESDTQGQKYNHEYMNTAQYDYTMIKYYDRMAGTAMCCYTVVQLEQLKVLFMDTFCIIIISQIDLELKVKNVFLNVHRVQTP